jgi:diaminopimelate decarboxylase
MAFLLQALAKQFGYPFFIFDDKQIHRNLQTLAEPVQATR